MLCEYTGTEVTSIIAWRYVRNNQCEWHAYRLREEFGLGAGTIRDIFASIGEVIRVEKMRGISTGAKNGGMYSCRVYTLLGVPDSRANGSPLSTKAGAFVIAHHLAVVRDVHNADLAEMVGWNIKRTRQVVLYRMRHLPLWREAKGGVGTTWHVLS